MTIDTTPPTVSVTPLSTGDSTPALSGSINESSAVVRVTVAGNTYTATVNGSSWSLPDNTISPPLGFGTYDVAVTATDLAGNVGADTTTNELDGQVMPVSSTPGPYRRRRLGREQHGQHHQ